MRGSQKAVVSTYPLPFTFTWSSSFGSTLVQWILHFAGSVIPHLRLVGSTWDWPVGHQKCDKIRLIFICLKCFRVLVLWYIWVLLLAAGTHEDGEGGGVKASSFVWTFTHGNQRWLIMMAFKARSLIITSLFGKFGRFSWLAMWCWTPLKFYWHLLLNKL